ncbi:MAG: ABC transporter ATP-binding protein [Puniceicoccaceae bacterium]
MFNLSNFSDLYRKVYRLARPYGRRKPAIVLVVILAQGIFQVAGVTSIFPFLALAAEPDAFRTSKLGETILSCLPTLENSQLLLLAGLFAIFTLALANLTNFISDYIRARYAHGLGHFLRTRLLAEMASKPWSYYLENNTGVLLKKASGDVMQMVYNVILPSLEAVARFVTAVLLVITLFVVDIWIAVTSGTIVILFYAATYRLLQKSRVAASERMKVADRGAMQEAQQLLGGIKPVRISGSESHFVERFSQHSHEQAKVQAVLPLYFQTPKYILEPVAFGGVIAAVLVYASLGQSLQEILPSLGVIALAGYRLLPAAQIFYGQLSQISTSRYSVEEVAEEFEPVLREVHRSPKTSSSAHAQTLGFENNLRLEKVSFQYPGAPQPIFDNLSLNLPKNHSLGIIGKTGSGKSTLVDIILGLHQPTSGEVYADEVPINEANIHDWRRTIGYVPQEIFLIDDTIARNIAFGLPDHQIDQERLQEAAKAAQILSFIEEDLPEGFATIVGERGIRLSGGQRQRIGLARALYSNPELLILDEATSALDHETEAEVMRAINAQRGQITMIVIAHRLSTVEQCDFLLDLNQVSQ